MIVHQSYKIELKLNKTQGIACAKGAGISRFAYNWKLGQLIELYEKAKKEAEELGLKKISCKFGNAIDWHKEWVLLKEELTWIRESSKCCGQEALRDLEGAFKKFFSKKAGYPKFKKKGDGDSFRMDGSIYVGYDWIQLPRIGKVKLKEHGYAIENKEGFLIPKQVTVSRQADRWYVSFSMQEEIADPAPILINEIKEEDIVGLDLGITELGITSDGQVFENPKARAKQKQKLARYQRQMSRKKKGSKNKKKAGFKVARLHRKMGNVRKDASHKMTTSLVKAKPKVLVVETLKPKNMMKNHNLAGSIGDAAFGEIKRQLKYKCEREGILLIEAPMFYASSKHCSECGYIHRDLKLSDREWQCPRCKEWHQRDVCSGKNLKFFAMWLLDLLPTGANTGSSPEINACGDERLQFFQEQCSSAKQEFKARHTFA